MRALLQVTQNLQSDQTLQVLHDFVAERQGGNGNFSFIVPGPPGLRQELGEDKLSSTLEELGLAPSACLTVQATSKKGLVTAAPEGAQFASVSARSLARLHLHLRARLLCLFTPGGREFCPPSALCLSAHTCIDTCIHADIEVHSLALAAGKALSITHAVYWPYCCMFCSCWLSASTVPFSHPAAFCPAGGTPSADCGPCCSGAMGGEGA